MKPNSRMRAISYVGLFAVLYLFAGLGAFGQEEFPKAEIFAGASLLCSGCSQTGRELFGGWQAGVSGNLRHDFAVVGDFGGQYRSLSGISLSEYQYLGGTRYTYRGERVSAFTHGLIGGVTLHASGFTSTGFALGSGGGVDVSLNRKWSIRVFQFDYIPARFTVFGFSGWSHELRLGIGFVIKSGT